MNTVGNPIDSQLPVAPFTNMVNSNPNMDNYSHEQLSVGLNYLSIPKLERLRRWSLGMNKYFHPTFYNGCDYFPMLELKLNNVSKGVPDM